MAKKGPLSVWEAIALHLSRFSRYAEEFEVPAGVTQEGIAAGCGVSRAHAALELGKLVAKGKVVERLAHVRGARTKKKVYFLGPEAHAEAVAMRERALRGRLVFAGQNGKAELDGPAALQRLTGALGVPEARALGMLMAGGEVDEAKLASQKAPSAPGAWPAPEHFAGREEEMRELRKWLAGDGRFAVIIGMPGIGKSSLAAKAFADAGVPTLWHRASAMDSPERFAAQVARFAGLPGFPLQGTRVPDAREIAAALSADPKKRLVVVGGYGAASKGLDPFMEALKGGRGGLKFALCCESKPGFYGVPDTAGGAVAELRLAGLDEDSALELLERRGVAPRKAAKRLFGITGGHPMALSLIMPSTEVAERDALRHLVRDVLGGLSSDEFASLTRFSVHRASVPPSAALAEPTVVDSLVRYGLLSEDDSGGLAAHAAVRAAVESCAGQQALKSAHSAAADYCLNADMHSERLYHLWKSGRSPEAARHLKMHRADVLADGSAAEALAIARECCLGKSDELDDLVAELAIAVGDDHAALDISKALASSKSSEIASRAKVRTARLMLRMGDLDGALKMLEPAKGACGAEGLRVLGGLQRKSGEYEKAALTLGKALSAAKKAKDWRLAGEAANELGVISLDLCDTAGARKRLDEALSYAEKAGERGDAAVVMANIGLALANAGDFKSASAKFSGAMLAARKAGLLRLEAAVATNLAHLQFSTGDFKAARRTGERAVELLEQLGDRMLVGAARINLGKALVRLKHPRARETLESGVESSKGLPVPGLSGRRLADAAAGFAELGDSARAKELAKQAAELLRAVGDEKGALEAEGLTKAATVRKG
jgi:tetratricopeptide (TPR) repeat protein